MADYWKSQPRHFCEFCKCWIADNKPSRDFHEKGKRHKENVERKIKEVREKSEKHWKAQQEKQDFLQQMEAAALKAAAKDIASDPSLASQYGIKTAVERPPSVNIETVSSWAVPGKRLEEEGRQDQEEESGPWVESTSPEGYTYYYNTISGESQWELPASIKPSEDTARNVGAEKEGVKAEAKAPVETTKSEGDSCQWVQSTSPEGHTYYYNTETGESQWEKPSNFISGKTAKESAKKARENDKQDQDQKEETIDKGLKEEVEKEEKEEKEGVKKEKKEERPLKRKSAYGEWTTIVQQSSKDVDLQLPCGAADEVHDPTPQFTEEPVRVKFKEKTVTSLSSDVFSSGEHVGFKKKKVRADRSIRRRGNED